MIRNAKAKGSRQEHRTMRMLEARGYRCTRAAASLGEWDVIGIGTVDAVLVQVKSNRWPRSGEMRVLRAFVVPPGVRKLLVRWRDGVMTPDVRQIA